MTTTAIITKTATINTKALARKAARRTAQQTTRAALILASTFSRVTEDEVVRDSAGRIVRQTAATNDEIRSALIGNRVIDTIEIMEVLGMTAFNNLVANGSLKRDAKFNRFSKNNLYWVTSKARELYNLPARIRLSSGIVVDYVEAA